MAVAIFKNSLFTRNQQFQQPTHKSNFKMESAHSTLQCAVTPEYRLYASVWGVRQYAFVADGSQEGGLVAQRPEVDDLQLFVEKFPLCVDDLRHDLVSFTTLKTLLPQICRHAIHSVDVTQLRPGHK